MGKWHWRWVCPNSQFTRLQIENRCVPCLKNAYTQFTETHTSSAPSQRYSELSVSQLVFRLTLINRHEEVQFNDMLDSASVLLMPRHYSSPFSSQVVRYRRIATAPLVSSRHISSRLLWLHFTHMVRFRKRLVTFGFTRDANLGILRKICVCVTHPSTPNLQPSWDWVTL